jgi:hypothetical protein
MTKKDEDIFEFKLPLAGVADINLRALFRRFQKKKDANPVVLVAKRFLQIFQDHDVAISQIPRLIPQLSLDQLRNIDSLLPALTPEILQQAAELFQVRREWLEGTSDVIYNRYYCYKNPWRFFEDLKTLNIDDFGFPLVFFCSAKILDGTKGRQQRLVPVLREECAKLGEKIIYRYRIYDDGWDWGYWKCRIQLKAMIRIWWMKYELPVPVIHINKKELNEIESGHFVPHIYFKHRRRAAESSLEDYSMSPDESAVSKEVEELPLVTEYIRAYKLEQAEPPERNELGNTARFC